MRFRLIVVGLLVLGTLASCGRGSSSEATLEGGWNSGVITARFSDSSGYEFELTWRAQVASAELDIFESPPGKAKVKVKVNAAIEITNVTPGRKSGPPLALPAVNLAFVYPTTEQEAELCEVNARYVDIDFEANTFPTGPFVCLFGPTVEAPELSFETGEDLAPDESRESRRVGDWTSPDMPEEGARRLVELINSGTGWDALWLNLWGSLRPTPGSETCNPVVLRPPVNRYHPSGEDGYMSGVDGEPYLCPV